MADITTLGAVIQKTLRPFSPAQLAVKSRVVSIPPTSPVIGDRYVVPSGATGVWTGLTNRIATFEGSWKYALPSAGWSTWLQDESLEVLFNGSVWILADTTGGGGGGPGEQTVYQADEALSALRVVRHSRLGFVVYARPPEVEARAPTGVTAAASNSGEDVALVRTGPIRDASWNWTPGLPILLGTDGVLTQSQPGGQPYLVVVGQALSADTMFVRITPALIVG